MGTTGVIFAAIAIAWLAYLVPHFVRRQDDEATEETDPASRFSDSVRIVQHGTAPLLDQDLEEIEAFEVSTPLTRRAAIAELRRLDRLAASRRRRVLMALMAVLSAVIGVCAVGVAPWWSLAVPGGLLATFVVVARFSVRRMSKQLNQRYAELVGGSDEVTVMLSRKDTARGIAVTAKQRGSESSTADSTNKPAQLWDPIPVTMPTYVSKPLAPRTVRTIDLSGPDVSTAPRQTVPVTADAPARPALTVTTERDEPEAASA